MGIVNNVGYDEFPKQGEYLNTKVKVCFRYDSSKMLNGTIVRDDMEEPFQTLIKLEDGRIVRGVECMYSHAREGK